jgi:hypothetical protein
MRKLPPRSLPEGGRGGREGDGRTGTGKDCGSSFRFYFSLLGPKARRSTARAGGRVGGREGREGGRERGQKGGREGGREGR